MEKTIKEIEELANIYGWDTQAKFEWHFNFRNEDNILLSVYWNKKGNITAFAKVNGRTCVRKNLKINSLELIFKDYTTLKRK